MLWKIDAAMQAEPTTAIANRCGGFRLMSACRQTELRFCDMTPRTQLRRYCWRARRAGDWIGAVISRSRLMAGSIGLRFLR